MGPDAIKWCSSVSIEDLKQNPCCAICGWTWVEVKAPKLVSFVNEWLDSHSLHRWQPDGLICTQVEYFVMLVDKHSHLLVALVRTASNLLWCKNDLATYLFVLFFCILFLTACFLPAGLSAAHFCTVWLLHWSVAAKWARLLITTNCCLSTTANV